jgi:hypothetical protein
VSGCHTSISRRTACTSYGACRGRKDNACFKVNYHYPYHKRTHSSERTRSRTKCLQTSLASRWTITLSLITLINHPLTNHPLTNHPLISPGPAKPAVEARFAFEGVIPGTPLPPHPRRSPMAALNFTQGGSFHSLGAHIEIL